MTLTLSYSKSEDAPAGAGEGGYHMCPVQLSPLVDGEVTYTYTDEYEALSLYAEQGDLAWPALFVVNMLGELPAPPMPGYELGSGIFNVETINGEPIQAPVDITFGLYGNVRDAERLRYDPDSGGWTAEGTVTIDADMGVATVSTTTMGVYAVLSPISEIPTVSEWGLIVMTLLGLTVGTLLLLKRRRAVPR